MKIHKYHKLTYDGKLLPEGLYNYADITIYNETDKHERRIRTH